MAMTKKDYEQLNQAAVEFFTTGKIKTKCPLCGGKLKVIVTGNSYRIECLDENKVLDIERGI